MFRTLTPIFAVVIAIAIYFFFTQPMFADIRGVQGQVDEFQQAVDSAEQYNQMLQTLITKKESMSARNMERLEALVPETVDEIHLIVDLEALAQSHGMLIGNFEVDSANDAIVGQDRSSTKEVGTVDELAYVDVTFGLIGTYDQFRVLLGDLERSLYRLEVISISFSAGESDLQQYDLTVRSYALPS